MKDRDYRLNLVEQMAECDANYIRLLKLIPAFRKISTASKKPFQRQLLEQGQIAQFIVADQENNAGKIVLEINVLEAFKYTTTLEIIQKPKTGHWFENPTMQVRVYHDACTTEVTSYQGHRNFQPIYQFPNPRMYHRDEKNQVNRFLGEWLTHCLQYGRIEKVPDLTYSV